MFEAELLAGRGKELGAVGGAAVSKHALTPNAVLGVEADGLMERVEHARDFLVRKKTGESESGVILNGNMQAFDSRAAVAKGDF